MNRNFFKSVGIQAALYFSGVLSMYYFSGHHWIFVVVAGLLWALGDEYFNKWFKIKE